MYFVLLICDCVVEHAHVVPGSRGRQVVVALHIKVMVCTDEHLAVTS